MKLKIIKIIRAMGAIFVLLGLIILILILYLLLPSVECFTNSYSKEEIEVIINREIIVIKTAYDKIKDYYNRGFVINSVEVENEKATIKNSFSLIFNAVPSSTDKMTVNQIYYGSSTNYGLRRVFNEPNDANFMSAIDKIKRLQPNTSEINTQINNIITSYNDIKSLVNNKQPTGSKKAIIKTSIDDIRSRLSNINDKEKMDIIITAMRTIVDNNDNSNFNLKANEIAALLFIQSSGDVITLRSNYQFFKSSENKTPKKEEIITQLNGIKDKLKTDVDKRAMDLIITAITGVLNNPTNTNNDEIYNSNLSLIETLLLQSAPDITLLRNYFTELQTATNKDEKKTQITNLLNIIKGRLSDLTDKQKLDVIYYGTSNLENDNYGIVVYLDEIDDAKFNKLIDKIKAVIPAIMNTSSYKNSFVDEIKIIFSELNNLYRDIYINNLYTYEAKREEIATKNKLIYAKLLVITTFDKINEMGISYILNTSLQRAYQRNDTIEINTNKLSFEEKMNNLKLGITTTTSSPASKPFISKSDQITTITGISDSSNGTPIENTLTSTPISRKVRDFTLDNISEDFNNIYNAFELMNIIYKNKANISKIDNYSRTILISIDNISNYYPNNQEYKNKVVSIRNVIIKPIISNDLYQAYVNDNFTSIAKNKNKFLSAVNELKNLVINNYGKRRGVSLNTNICFDNIIKAVNNYKYPVRISNISGCDISMFNDRDIFVSKKMFVSENDGIMWKPATNLADYKKTGINNYPYLYNYSIAISADNGNNWNMI